MFDINLFNLFLIPLFGFAVGLLVSMLGGGGGGLYAPVLILVFGVPTQTAIAASLASVLPTTLAGTLGHYREGNVDVNVGLVLGVGGIIGTLIGAYFANLIPSDLLERILGVFILIMMIPMIRSLMRRRRKQNEEEMGVKRETVKLTGIKRILASLFGVAGGLTAGLFGLSGSGPIVAGLYSLDMPAVMVVGTSLFVLIFNSIAGIGGYYLLGRLDLPLILLLCGGAVVGAFLGPQLLKKVNPKTLEKAYGPILVSTMLILSVTLIIA